jgi:type I restriction enzyme S subunit
MEYKRLGDYIREVNVRNKDLKVTKLVGLTIDKAFIPSVANVIGTDLSNYKVIRKEQFACSLMQVSRDGKMPVAMFEEDAAIMSPAYPMFEVIDKKTLLPQYLMMWFSRSEFDREASYYVVGGVRGSLTWEDFCNMKFPVPSIDRQREIVEEYETLSRRICMNEQMIEKLEATAQALYRKMFVDGIDKENLPEGWRNGVLGEVCETQYGYTETATQQIVGPKFLRITDVVNDSIDWSKVPYCPISEKELKKYKLGLGDIVVSRTGANIGWAKQIKGDIPDSVFASFLIRIKAKDADMQWMIGHLVESSDFKAFVAANQQGSAQPQANANILVEFPLIIPDTDSLQLYNLHILPINRMLCVKEQENTKLSELQSLLLVKMGNLKQ